VCRAMWVGDTEPTAYGVSGAKWIAIVALWCTATVICLLVIAIAGLFVYAIAKVLLDALAVGV